MKKVKITVLRCTFNEDMAQQYAEPGLKPCSVFKEGQVFYAGLGKPDGFCDGAWRTIHPYVFALANGVKRFYFNDWVRHDGILPAVTTVCALSFSSWRLQMKKYRHHLNTGHEVAKINLEGETVTPCKACLACAGKKNCVWRNDIFLNKEMFVVGPTYWNIAYGKLPGESLKDNESVETMKNLGKNISWILDRLS